MTLCQLDYFSLPRYDLQLIRSVDLWTFCGIGYTVGQFFNLKYVIFYGFPRAFYFADNIEDIPTPRYAQGSANCEPLTLCA